MLAGAAFFKAASAASFWQAKKKNVSVWSRSHLEPPFLPGAGADPIWSEPESAPGRPEPEPHKKVAAPQHYFKKPFINVGLSKRISLRNSPVLSKVEPEPDLYTGSGSDQKVPAPAPQHCYLQILNNTV